MKKPIALFILCVLTAAGNAQSLTIQLSKTNITCYNARNGSVNLTVSGGTSPYTFQWSNGATTEDISTLPPNYYAVTVTDAASNTATDGVTITEPAQIIYQFATSDYIVNGTHYNLSSYTWHNGSISTNVAGGVAPYTYLWSNGATTANISSLDAGSYRMTITDATSCTVLSDGVALTKPDRSDWTMSGNANSNPSTQFIGTSDAQDLSFRTNNQEALRIKANGDLKINKFVGGADMIYADNNGILQGIGLATACPDVSFPIWRKNISNPDWLMYLCPLTTFLGVGTDAPKNKLDVLGNIAIGTYAGVNAAPANGMIVSGNIGIGTTSPSEKLQIGSRFTFCDLGTTQIIGYNYHWDGSIDKRLITDYSSAIYFTQGNLSFRTAVSSTANSQITWIEGLRIANNGTVGIGINPTSNNANTYKLVVGGKFGANEIWCAVGNAGSPWPDYVFNKNHKLISLSELESFVAENKHLPGMPSAKEISSQDKINLGDMQIKILEKTEENTLYILQLKKEIDELKKENQKLAQKISSKN